MNKIKKISSFGFNRLLGEMHVEKSILLFVGLKKVEHPPLDYYLREHSEVCMANKKEVHFFDDEQPFKVNIVRYSNYHAWFSPNSTTQSNW